MVLKILLTAEDAEDFAEGRGEETKLAHDSLPGSEEQNMNEKLRQMTRLTKMILLVPLAILGILILAAIGGEVVMLLWNWLAPALFGLRQVTFLQAVGLLALCRILFGGFGLGGGAHRNSRRRMEGRIRERIDERMRERWEQMTPEERERFRRGFPGCGAQTTPLDSNPTA